MKSGAGKETEAESEVADEAALIEVDAFISCTLSFAVPEAAAVVSALDVMALDEGAEAFRLANGLLEGWEELDLDGNVEEAGAGEDIICLKMLEVAEAELLLISELVFRGVD